MSVSSASLRASIAASTRWAQEPDRRAATAKARAGFVRRFEREVDPDGILDPAERAIRAGYARRAHMTRLALKSKESRAARANARRLDSISSSATKEDTSAATSPAVEDVLQLTDPTPVTHAPDYSSALQPAPGPDGSGASSRSAISASGGVNP